MRRSTLTGVGLLFSMTGSALGQLELEGQQQLDEVATTLAARPISTQVPFAVAFHPNGDRIAVGTGDGRLILWSHGSGREASVQAHQLWTFCIVWSKDGSRIMTGGGDDLVHVRDAQSLELIATLRGHTDDVHALALSPDDRVLYSVGDDLQLIAWDLKSGEPIYKVTAHAEQIPALAISADGKMLATGSRDDSVKVWNASNGRLRHSFEGHLNDVLDVDFSPDGRWIASGSYDTTVMLWNVKKRRREAVILEAKDRVFAVKFGPDGRTLWSGGEDNMLVVTQLTEDRPSSKQGSGGDIARLAVSPDGQARAYTSSDGYVRWTTWSPATPGDWVTSKLKVDPTAASLEQ